MKFRVYSEAKMGYPCQIIRTGLSFPSHLSHMLCRIILTCTICFLGAVSSVFAQIEYMPQVVVVQFTSFSVQKTLTTGLQEFDRKAAQYQVHQIERVYPFLDHVNPTPQARSNWSALRRTYYVRYHSDTTPEYVAKDLNEVPGVVYSEPLIMSKMYNLPIPNDRDFSKQTELQHLQLPEAWDIVRSESGTPRVVIAIVDGGGDWRHEDLRANVWTNEDEIPNNRIDDDRNGFIDDVHGINYPNEDPNNNDPTGLVTNPLNAGHGTNSAGLAGAVTNNNTGIAGAAWNPQIMHINAGCPDVDSFICYAYEGVVYAASNGADIINASWGNLATETDIKFYNQSLDFATDMGSLIVGGAGNDALSLDIFRFYPARHPRVLSVGATQKNSRSLAEFSNYGSIVDVFAPGKSVLTTAPDNSYELVRGTSFATPLVSGVAALVKTKHPDWTPDMVREHIRLTSANMDADNPNLIGELGRGFVNALEAVQTLPTRPAIRIKRWYWTDDDGNEEIKSGDEVTITAVLANYLVDAEQLRIQLAEGDPYPFLDWVTREANIGTLLRDDSVKVKFTFRITENAPINQSVRLFIHTEEGDFEDRTGIFSLQINQDFESVHRNLSAFYRSTGGSSWRKNDNWNLTKVPTASEFRLWHGVLMVDGLLAGLTLNQNNLTGTLPPELGNLSRLWTLSLRENALSGPIPPELGRLSNLNRLTLDNNTLSGPIPPELGNLSQMTRLWLYQNTLSGEIPSELGQLSQMESLELHQNTLSGEIPSELGQLSNLQALTLHNNTLSGSIPPELGNLFRLRRLRLENNELSGPIPRQLGLLSSLERLIMNDNKASGEIPPELGNLVKLRDLNLESNALSGEIPPELGKLSNLQVLHLGRNNLSGEIPAELGNLLRVEKMYLENGSLSGEIPPQLGNLLELEDLLLHRNDLSGPIPPELGRLSRLKRLTLDNNSLSGEVPPELGDLSQLTKLFLGGNSLTGSLPRSLMKLKNLELLYFGAQKLCAPKDDEFQAWLKTVPKVNGLTCSGDVFEYHVADQSYRRNRAIATLDMPEITGGGGPFTYTLSPELPQGLRFHPSSRTISGRPIDNLPPTYFTYTATNAQGEHTRLQFRIHVFPHVSSSVRNTALESLYTSTDGENWAHSTGWKITSPPADGELENWHGVQATGGQIYALNLQQNTLLGEIPSELGALEGLIDLNLSLNALSSTIPPEIGELTELQQLDLHGNILSGPVPAELGNLKKLRRLRLHENSLTGQLPRSLTQLKNLETLTFGGQGLCAPRDREFQEWLKTITVVEGPACTGLVFAAQIADQLYPVTQPIQPVTLPAVTAGKPPIRYTLSPELPLGLSFDAETRTIRGTPTTVTPPTLFAYEATDADGIKDSQVFQIRVFPYVSNTVRDAALSALYRSTGGENWFNDSGWDLDAPPSDEALKDWYGVHATQGQVEQIRLQKNNLTGRIPLELGQLSGLEQLHLQGNLLTGTVPGELGNLSELRQLALQDNALGGSLPRGLMQLDNLENLFFGGQALCAPRDDMFQAWLKEIANTSGAACPLVAFAEEAIDQSYARNTEITPLVLPEATGVQPVTYEITPALPSGLSFDPETRTIRGTPVDVLPPTTLTYTATDADGASVTQQFQLEVYSPVGRETEGVPTEFAVHANYPNPFRQSTRMVFDLPWPARVQIDVMDVLGRQVHSSPPEDLEAGFHEMEWSGTALPSGAYLYRLTATSHESRSVYVGRFVRVR